MTANGEAVCTVSLDENIKACACIHSLSVEENNRRMGYGKMLLDESENEARRLGAKVVSLAAIRDSFMADWYQRMGYTPLFTEREYITFYKQIK